MESNEDKINELEAELEMLNEVRSTLPAENVSYAALTEEAAAIRNQIAAIRNQIAALTTFQRGEVSSLTSIITSPF